MKTHLFRLGLCGLVISCVVVVALLLTAHSVSKARALDFNQAAARAREALIIVKPLSWLTLGTVPDIELWREALTLLSQSAEFTRPLTQLKNRDHSLNRLFFTQRKVI